MFAIATSPLSFIATAPISFAARAGVSMIAEVPLPDIKAISLISTLKVGDGVLAGDIGFDPLGLGDTSEKLTFYREAEVKHARLVVLAAAGWPVA